MRGRLLPGLPGAPRRVGGAAPARAGEGAGGCRRARTPLPCAASAVADVAMPTLDRAASTGPPCSAGSALLLTVLGARCIHFVGLVGRGLAADPDRVPWGNMYEFALTGTFVRRVLYLVLLRKLLTCLAGPGGHRLRGRRPDARPAARSTSTPARWCPALHSYWLVIHVVAAIIATGAFTLGGDGARCCSWSRTALAGAARCARAATSPGCPRPQALDRCRYRLHAFGFPIWTFAALIAGPIWAQYAWGTLLGLGPQGGLGVHHLGRLRRLPARPRDRRLEGPAAAIIALVGLATLCSTSSGSTSSSAAAASTRTPRRPTRPRSARSLPGPVGSGCRRPSSRGARLRSRRKSGSSSGPSGAASGRGAAGGSSGLRGAVRPERRDQRDSTSRVTA